MNYWLHTRRQKQVTRCQFELFDQIKGSVIILAGAFVLKVEPKIVRQHTLNVPYISIASDYEDFKFVFEKLCDNLDTDPNVKPVKLKDTILRLRSTELDITHNLYDVSYIAHEIFSSETGDTEYSVIQITWPNIKTFKPFPDDFIHIHY